MFTFIESVARYFSSPYKYSEKEEFERIFMKLEAIESEYNAENHRDIQTSYMPDTDESEWLERQGSVTHLYSDGSGYIDQSLMFKREMVANLSIKKGDIVKYSVRKIANGVYTICRITSIEGESWSLEAYLNGEEDLKKESAETPIDTFDKWVPGTIEKRQSGILTISITGEKLRSFEVALNEIDCNFLPRSGDEVCVCIKFQRDVAMLNFAGEPLGVCGIKPAVTKKIKGMITYFKKKLEFGIIDKDCIFFMDVLMHSDNIDDMPDNGDAVIAEIIESKQSIDCREFGWRCIKMVKTRTFSDKNNDKQIIEESVMEKQTDQVDVEDTGIEMTENSELVVFFECTGEKKVIQFVVSNTSRERKTIPAVVFDHVIASAQVDCPDLFRARDLPPNGKHVFNITVKGKICGTTKLLMNFNFGSAGKFRRCITVNVKKAVDEDSVFVPIIRSKQYTKSVYNDRSDIVKGVKPKAAPHFIEVHLDRFDVPPALFDAVMKAKTHFELDALLSEITQFPFDQLTFNNYAKYFQSLLHIEECCLRHEFGKYNQDRAHFQREGEYLALQMRGNVLESRPSITIGDIVYAKQLFQNENYDEPNKFQGFIHHIRRNRLLIKFSDAFHNRYNGEDYSLTFGFSRARFIKLHNAVEKVTKKSGALSILFPKQVVTPATQVPFKMLDGQMAIEFNDMKSKWYNEDLNEVQKNAVMNVMRGELRPMPYVIFGPPGTGKTSTIIEIILQLFHKCSHSRLLVAAPSNSAANLITKRLADSKALNLGEFIRIISKTSIEREQIPEELLPYCATIDIAAPNSGEDTKEVTASGLKLNYNSFELSSHRILIGTCNTFGSLLYMNVNRMAARGSRKNHFTHVIIDEAGQCSEPEAVIPIALLDQKDVQIILAGDPKQLGPVIISPYSKTRGLGKSMLMRLLDFLPYSKDYKDGNYDERLVTKLLYNYRSLPSILQSFSDLFYDSELIPTISETEGAEKALLTKLQDAVFNINKSYGIHFIGVRGHEERTADSTSWRNPEETLKVWDTVTRLYDCGFTDEDIGVISPYTLQVKNIRLIFNDEFDSPPKVGSVEEFQGQERNIIIISTVRTKAKNFEQDQKYGLGFINNARRLNVAISRARAAVIIIGHPYVLMNDPNWKHLLTLCITNGTYSGWKCDLSKIINV